MASNLEILPGLKSYGHAFLQTHALVDTNMNVLIMETVQTTEKKKPPSDHPPKTIASVNIPLSLPPFSGELILHTSLFFCSLNYLLVGDFHSRNADPLAYVQLCPWYILINAGTKRLCPQEELPHCTHTWQHGAFKS